MDVGDLVFLSVRSVIFEVLANIIALGPSEAGRIAASVSPRLRPEFDPCVCHLQFPGLHLLISPSPTNSTLVTTLQFLVEVSLVGIDAKEAITAGMTFVMPLGCLVRLGVGGPTISD